MRTSSVHSRSGRLRSQRGWLRNPFPSSLRIVSRMVAHAMRMFAQAGPRKALFETLEPRLLLSADPASYVTDAEMAQGIGDVAMLLDEPHVESTVTIALDADAAETGESAAVSDAALVGPTAEELDALLAEAAARMSYQGQARIEVID